MEMTDPLNEITIAIKDLAEIAANSWKLEQWVGQHRCAESLSMPRHFGRKMNTFLQAYDLSFIDLTGQPFDVGLSVEIIDSIEDSSLSEGQSIIGEVIRPVVLWRGVVIRHGEVVLRVAPKAVSQIEGK